MAPGSSAAQNPKAGAGPVHKRLPGEPWVLLPPTHVTPAGVWACLQTHVCTFGIVHCTGVPDPLV
jgi:hypothetical protein